MAVLKCNAAGLVPSQKDADIQSVDTIILPCSWHLKIMHMGKITESE